ncbi:MAG: putative copper-binding protein plastocyanin/az urin family protein [Myxococcales bacterium]|nr:putative copper-binding protein plastocyanin/az urin family protein [Myxococcales bacterium]
MRAYATITVCLLFATGGCDETNPNPNPGPTSVPPADLAATQDLSATASTDMATTSPDMTTAPSPVVVEVRTTDGLMFVPSSVTIPVGGTVVWRNSGAVAHTVTSGASSTASDNPGMLFDHNPLIPGQTFSFTFTVAGIEPYFCRFHEAMGMKGTVVVTP